MIVAIIIIIIIIVIIIIIIIIISRVRGLLRGMNTSKGSVQPVRPFPTGAEEENSGECRGGGGGNYEKRSAALLRKKAPQLRLGAVQDSNLRREALGRRGKSQVPLPLVPLMGHYADLAE